ncbi:DUF4398 domain-containing protein [Saccharospirillum sp.]|uniref:DUF4398 domain-containing protein n=1 Tax=Saccharospirillum sp. TaxID=2033801 RepID=UPI0034A00D70
MLPVRMRSFSDHLLATVIAVVTVVLLSACASAPVSPESTLTSAREAIASAERAGARQYAAAELDEAQQKLILADEAVTNEEMEEAERFAQQSLIVAELALARTESAKALEINQEINRSTDALIEEMQRVGE